MKNFLLPESGNFYKANLHTHTTISDGEFTPEEVKKAYMEQGYSVVAFTDHEVLVPHKELTDENFVAITSFEKGLAMYDEKNWFYQKKAHFCLYAKDEDNVSCPVINVSKITDRMKQYVTEDVLKIVYHDEYSIKGFNDVIKKANDAGFLVSFNHPVWSLQNYEDYNGIKGLWGVEVYNSTCAVEGYPDTVQPFEDLLRSGEKVFPLATDDLHKAKDRFGGFVMIKSPVLKYGAIMQALEKGDFYASTGPEIKTLYVENGILVVECSPARSITLATGLRVNQCVNASEEQQLTRAEFNLANFFEKVGDDENAYVRIDVKGFDGSHAYTRAYFLNELKK